MHVGVWQKLMQYCKAIILQLKIHKSKKSKGDAFESVLMRWMNLEAIIQSETSQKKKTKHHIVMHLYGM